jgi:hypothetical protein
VVVGVGSEDDDVVAGSVPLGDGVEAVVLGSTTGSLPSEQAASATIEPQTAMPRARPKRICRL